MASHGLERPVVEEGVCWLGRGDGGCERCASSRRCEKVPRTTGEEKTKAMGRRGRCTRDLVASSACADWLGYSSSSSFRIWLGSKAPRVPFTIGTVRCSSFTLSVCSALPGGFAARRGHLWGGSCDGVGKRPPQCLRGLGELRDAGMPRR